MKMIQCVSPKTSGRLEVMGLDVESNERKIKHKMGVVPQENNLDPDFTVYENLLVYSRYFDIPPQEAEKRINELLDFVHLQDRKDTMTESLSGGMKRRLILARSLINNPSLLVLDEPTVGLDPQARHILWDRIMGLKHRKVTIVLTTHYLEEASYLCDRLVIMDHGKILIEGKPKEIVNEHIGTDILELNYDPQALKCLNKNGMSFDIAGEMIHVYTNDPEKVMKQIMGQCSLSRITARQATLEDVFLKITGRKLRE